MNFSIYNQFGAKNSADVFSALALSLTDLGHNVSYHNDDADVAIIWSQLWAGRMRHNQSVWSMYQDSNRPVVVVEVGALKRNQTWRLMVNGKNCLLSTGNNHQRFESMGLTLFPWTNQGTHILIACQRPESQQWHGKPDINTWLEQTVSEIRQHSERPIKIRPHPRHRNIRLPFGCSLSSPTSISGTYDEFDFVKECRNAWCVVNVNSNPGVEAVLLGTPVFVDSSSIAAPVGNLKLDSLENPAKPCRKQWAWDLAHTEWTVEEIRYGIPMSMICERLEAAINPG